MAIINVDDLRDYMMDYCGTAAFGGFPAASLDLVDIERMDGHELCKKADQMGIDLHRFIVREDDGACDW